MRLLICCCVIAALLMLTMPLMLNHAIYEESNPMKLEARSISVAAWNGRGELSDIEIPDTIRVYDSEHDVLLTLGFDEYLYGVVMAEMPASFEAEALKAQAVAARSYAMYRLLYFPDTHECEAGTASLCTDYTHCKAYVSYESAVERWSKELVEDIYPILCGAVDATSGTILVYEGQPVNAVFHSMSYGATEAAVNLWGTDVPYLQSVETPETDMPVVETYSAEEFRAVLEKGGLSLSGDASEWVVRIERGDTGRVESVEFPQAALAGRVMRELFGLRSTDFELIYLDGSFIFTVHGYGHGVGMSQYGANALAGQGLHYEQILQHYYSGAQLWIQESHA